MIDQDRAMIEQEFESDCGVPPLPSFVTWDHAQQVYDLWNPTLRTGEHDIDLDLGRQHAATVIEMAQLVRDPSLIAATMQAMILKGFMGSLERGFLDTISRRTYVGSHN